jgi:transketolase
VPRGAQGARPRMVIAHTVKGKGVSFMENVRSWHADVMDTDQYDRAMAELREG